MRISQPWEIECLKMFKISYKSTVSLKLWKTGMWTPGRQSLTEVMIQRGSF